MNKDNLTFILPEGYTFSSYLYHSDAYMLRREMKEEKKLKPDGTPRTRYKKEYWQRMANAIRRMTGREEIEYTFEELDPPSKVKAWSTEQERYVWI